MPPGDFFFFFFNFIDPIHFPFQRFVEIPVGRGSVGLDLQNADPLPHNTREYTSNEYTLSQLFPSSKMRCNRPELSLIGQFAFKGYAHPF